jgi:formylglycine-generating enzyme required for sulfatase activity
MKTTVRIIPLLATSAVAIALLLAACGKDKPLRTFVNTPPEIRSLVANPDTLTLADTSIVTCDTYDPNLGDIHRYRWTATVGRFISRDNRLSQVSWIAPDSAGSSVVSVTVNDGTDSTSSAVEILVLGPSGTIIGTVRDAADQEPLAGAALEIGGRRATSVADGSYRITLVPPGLDTLRAALAGYEPFEQIVSVRVDAVDTVNVELARIALKSRLSGRVTNSLQAAVSGAACRAAGLEVLADAGGNYDFAELPRGTQVLTVFREGYVTERDTLELAEPEEIHDLTLDAATPGRPQGSMTATRAGDLGIRVDWAPSGDPATIVSYDLYVEDNGAAPQAVPGGSFGASGGRFDFTGVEDHRYRFAVTATNFENESGFLSDDTPLIVLAIPSPLAPIPAGAFVMGNTPEGFGNEAHPGDPVFTGAYGIETHEVTNRQFAAFLLEANDRQQLVVTATDVRAEGNVLLVFTGSQIDPDSAADGFSVVTGKERHPVTGVTWFGASAYARTIGRRLPTEAEWEKAARGTSSANGVYPGTSIGVGFSYPWGNAPPDAQHANFGDLFGSPRAVESFPNGAIAWGGVSVFDLAGNAAEWCADWRGAYVNPHLPPQTGVVKVVRGGHYSSGSPTSAPELLAGYRTGQTPATASSQIGFRCVE